MVGWLAACAALAAPHYDTAEHRADVAGAPLVLVQRDLKKELKQRGLKLVLDGQEVKTTSDRLWPHSVVAVRALLDQSEEGVEVDLILSVEEDGTLRLASLRWSVDRIEVDQGWRRGGLLADGPSAAELSETYGIGPLVDTDRKWDAQTRGVLRDALERLSAEERAILAPVRFERGKQPDVYGMSLDPNEPLDPPAAQFGSDGPWIRIHDSALKPVSTFRGTVSDPVHPHACTVLHEVGHAIAHAGASVVPRFLEAVGTEPAPTEYGRTSEHEHFAEAFSLYRCDPAALQRAAPKAAAFFEAGGHLR